MQGTAYRLVHLWVERRLGKPMHCENCGDVSKHSYNWANISGEYLYDIADWARLCVPCHRRFDGNSKKYSSTCRRGHKWVGDNIYVHPTKGRMCRRCKRRSYLRSKVNIEKGVPIP